MSSFMLILLIWFLNISQIYCWHQDPCDNRMSGIYPHPKYCQLYYNCSQPRDDFKSWLGDHVMECNYPDLFSEKAMRCESFEDVYCGERKKLEHACEYLNNLCDQELCRPCRSDFSCNDRTGSSNKCDYTSTNLLKVLTCPRDGKGHVITLDAHVCKPH